MEQKKEQQKKKVTILGHEVEKPVLYMAIIIIAAVILLIVGLSISLSRGKNKEEAVNDTEQEQVVYVPEVVKEEAVYTDEKKDIAALQEENPDIYAWITVPGTDIDYPVLQCDTDNYYLDHTVEKAEGLPGAIYTNKCNAEDFNDAITFVYGHNMKNGSYFGQLHKYEDEDFFDNNQEIDIYTIDRKIVYKIYSASTYTDDYLPDKYNVKFAEGIGNFLADLKEYGSDMQGSNFVEDMSVDDTTNLLVLSTCVSGQEEHRYLVVAVKEAEELYEE